MLLTMKLHTLIRIRFSSLKNNCGLRALLGFIFMIGTTFTYSTAQAQCVLTCRQNVTIPMPASGSVTVTPDMVLSSESGCGSSQIVSVFTSTGQVLPNATISCAYLGQTLSFSVVDVATTEYCLGTLRVLDELMPSIICPNDLTININDIGTCHTAVSLPNAIAFDNCSVASVIPSWQFGSGVAIYNNVPLGDYVVTYTASDGSGNTATCNNTIKVRDNASPIAICVQQITVQLDNTGITVVPASLINSESYDNCAIDYMEIERAGQAFSSAIYVTCSDVNAPVPVTLRVTDMDGRVNTCPSQLIVTEPFAPIITCPDDITITCEDDYNNLSLTGSPQATDNCLIASTSHSDALFLNNCGIGYIDRTWRTTDIAGNTASCMQRVTVQNNANVSVIFPPDYTISTCGGSVAPSITGFPLVTASGCTQPEVIYTDQIVNISQPACYNIIRKWLVINPCVYNPNNPQPEGYWTADQTISIIDNMAPVVVAPADVTVNLFGNTCAADVSISTNAMATDCNPNVVIMNNSPFATASGSNASGHYPKGIHRVEFTAADGCGNIGRDTMTITVRDINPPTPVCNSAVTIPIDNYGIATIDAATLIVGVNDNCTTSANISLTATPQTFTCASLGVQNVMIKAMDESGNSGFCSTLVVITDNSNHCTSGLVPIIKGTILNEIGIPIRFANVLVQGTMQDTVLTDTIGNYLFQNLTVGGNYAIRAVRDTDHNGGITTYDMVLIQRHLLGMQYLNSPYKIIAADINKSGTVTTFDLVQLRKLILQQITELPNNDAWRFVDASYTFPDPSNPFASAIPEVMNVTDFNTSVLDKNWVAIKVGDVNNSVDPNGLLSSEARHANTLKLRTNALQLQAEEVYELPIRAANFKDLIAYQGTLQFDTDVLTLLDILPNNDWGVSAENFGTRYLSEGMITTNWENFNDLLVPDDAVLFTLKMKANKTALLSEALRLTSARTKAEAYREEENLHLELEFTTDAAADTNELLAVLYQNVPNPFSQSTTIGFQLAEAQDVTLRVFDMQGKLLTTQHGYFDSGEQQFMLNEAKDALPNGVLYYQLSVTGQPVITKKMVKIN